MRGGHFSTLDMVIPPLQGAQEVLQAEYLLGLKCDIERSFLNLRYGYPSPSRGAQEVLQAGYLLGLKCDIERSFLNLNMVTPPLQGEVRWGWASSLTCNADKIFV